MKTFLKALPLMLVLACVSVLLFTGTAQAARAIGYAQVVTGEVDAIGPQKTRRLKAKSPVYQQDTIVTRKYSKVQFIFDDGTQIAMRQESVLKLDKFAYGRSRGPNDILSFIFGPGIFRILTGKIVERNPDKFNVQTPYGNLGIRGTEVGSIVEVEDGSRSQIVNGVTSLGAANELFSNLSQSNKYKENHAHLIKTKDRGLFYTDFNNKEVQIPYTKMIQVTDKGASKPMSIPGRVHNLFKKVKIQYNAPMPNRDYERRFGMTREERFLDTFQDGPVRDNDGGGNNGGGNDGGGHGGCL